MKFLVLAAMAFTGLVAQADGTKYPLRTVQLQKGARNVIPLAIGEGYSAQLSVGRISPVSMTVELVGWTVKQVADGGVAARTVKVMLNLLPEDQNDLDAAFEMLGKFFEVKTGVGHSEEIGEHPVAKTIGVTFATDQMQIFPDACLGADLESVSQGSNGIQAGWKTCHTYSPTSIIFSAL